MRFVQFRYHTHADEEVISGHELGLISHAMKWRDVGTKKINWGRNASSLCSELADMFQHDFSLAGNKIKCCFYLLEWSDR